MLSTSVEMLMAGVDHSLIPLVPIRSYYVSTGIKIEKRQKWVYLENQNH